MTERDHDIDLFGLAKMRHGLPRGFDRIGECHRASAAGVKLRFLTKQPKDAEADTAAFDDDVPTDQPVFRQALKARQGWICRRKVGIRRHQCRKAVGLGGYRDRCGRAIGPQVEIMVAEGRRVAADH